MEEYKMETAQLCENCQREQVWQHLVGKQEPGSVKDFPLGDIEVRKNCAFCKLLYTLIALNWKQSDIFSLKGTVCQLKTLPGPAYGINIYFREHSGMRIQVEKNVLGKDASNFKILSNEGSPQMDLARLRQILKTCLRDHERCRFKPQSDSHRKKINLLLIDVYQYCIVEKAYDCDRVALSYVWGKDQVLKTTTQTLAEFKKEGSLLRRQHEIPRTIWDAVLLVREVGQHYLWVDSFCIVQDDDKHKSEQINAMNSIYGHSLFTIIAISSLDANTGLPGVRPNTRPLRYISIGEKHALVATTNHLGSILGTSTYETRGWTFQERLLSPRCLYVSDWQYFFSCLTETCCEDGLPDESLEEDYDPHHATPNCLVRRLADLNGRMPVQMTFRIYAEIIENFSARSLTSPFDTVNAIAGINAVAVGSLGGLLCCGGPSALIEHCLLWIPAPKPGHQPIRNNYFPSWSWAGWMCPVNFKLSIDIFQVTRNSIISCRGDICMVNEMGPIQYIDILEIQAWACNAQNFRSGEGRVIKCETEPPLDNESNVVGIFLDTEVPPEPRKSSCWLIALFLAMKKHISTRPVAETGYEDSSAPGSNAGDGLDALGDEWQVVVMLVEEKGEHVERLGIGITSVNLWLPVFDTERKEFILK